MDSILTSIKKMLGITEEYEQFDQDIIMHINTVFMILNQLGVGPDDCFSIEDKDAVWTDFTGTQTDIEPIKTYVYLKVRMIFDPPTSSLVADAVNRTISELEWRLSVQVDSGEIR